MNRAILLLFCALSAQARPCVVDVNKVDFYNSDKERKASEHFNLVLSKIGHEVNTQGESADFIISEELERKDMQRFSYNVHKNTYNIVLRDANQKVIGSTRIDRCSTAGLENLIFYGDEVEELDCEPIRTYGMYELKVGRAIKRLMKGRTCGYENENVSN